MPVVGTRPTLVTESLNKFYPSPGGDVVALRDVSLDVAAGLTAVVGRSGSGKTTLMNLLAGIDRPTSGTVRAGDATINDLDETQLARWRCRSVGLVFQFFQLLPTLTVAENVMLPMDFLGELPTKDRRSRAHELLDRVGIAEQADKFPLALSGGQQQRAAIARALANEPPLLLADEPTGNLDSATADSILELFRDLAAAGLSVVMVTHERDIASIADRVVTLADGEVVSDNVKGRGSA